MEVRSATCTSTSPSGTVTVKGEPVHLTRIEFDILATLARNAGRVVTSRMLLDQVWGPEYEGDTQTLRVHVSHLRRKIESPGDVSRYILTEPGVGFRFVESDEPLASPISRPALANLRAIFTSARPRLHAS